VHASHIFSLSSKYNFSSYLIQCRAAVTVNNPTLKVIKSDIYIFLFLAGKCSCKEDCVKTGRCTCDSSCQCHQSSARSKFIYSNYFYFLFFNVLGKGCGKEGCKCENCKCPSGSCKCGK